MDLSKGIETRQSIRGFKSTPIPEKTLREVLKVAARSPSYTNTQPWEVAVVTGKKRDELSKILYDLADKSTPTNPDVLPQKGWPAELERRSREHGANRFKALGIERENDQQRKEMRLRNFDFYGGPCAIFLFMDSTLGDYSMYDMGLFSQTLCLAAHANGLGTCLQAALAGYPDAVRNFLGIPKTKKLVIGISMGYPDPKAKLNSYHSQRVETDAFTKWYS